MSPDITIEVRFKTFEEGGRAGSIVGKQFGCPMFVSGEAFDCRLFIEGGSLELGKTYKLAVKFLNPGIVLPLLVPGKTITLWEGKEIATGKVLSIGA